MQLDKNGGISVDPHGCSKTQSHVFAAGDVTADVVRSPLFALCWKELRLASHCLFMDQGLVSVAEMEGRHCVESMFCGDQLACPTPMSCTFLITQISRRTLVPASWC